MSLVLVPVGEVLYLHGSTLHPYPLAYQLCTVEVSIHKRNQLLDAFFLEDQGSFLLHIFPIVWYYQLSLSSLYHVTVMNSSSYFLKCLVTYFVIHLHWIEWREDYCRVICNSCIYIIECREHGVVGDMRDAWPSARVRKNVSLIHTYHGFKGTFFCAYRLPFCFLSIIWLLLLSIIRLVLLGDKQGTLEFLKLIFRALCLCWDRQTQDLHIDWILFRGRSLIPVSCEVVNDNIDGYYPSSHFPIFAEFMLPRTVRMLESPVQEDS